MAESVSDFQIPKHWARVWAIDVDRINASVLWAAHDRAADVLYVYSELVVPRFDLTRVADAVRVRSHRMPGLFDHLARKRTEQEGQRIIQALLDLHLDVFTCNADPDAAVAEVTHRLTTKRLKVFSSACPEWLSQYRSYRRNKDGDLVEESDGLMRAMDLLALSGPQIAAPDVEQMQEAQEEWATASRDMTTGY